MQGAFSKQDGLLGGLLRFPVPIVDFNHHGGAFQVLPQLTGVHGPKEDDVNVVEINMGSMGLPLGLVNRSLMELVPAVDGCAQPLGESRQQQVTNCGCHCLRQREAPSMGQAHPRATLTACSHGSPGFLPMGTHKRTRSAKSLWTT